MDCRATRIFFSIALLRGAVALSRERANERRVLFESLPRSTSLSSYLPRALRYTRRKRKERRRENLARDSIVPAKRAPASLCVCVCLVSIRGLPRDAVMEVFGMISALEVRLLVLVVACLTSSAVRGAYAFI